jgi:menaquinone-dependent protoporphyrinogen oxidase
MNRRVLLARGAMTAGAVAAVGGAGTFVRGFLEPRPSSSPDVRFPDLRCGNPDGGSVLLAYASEFGTTAEVAESVGRALGELGSSVEVRRVRDIHGLTGYDAVVVGAPIQFDTWMSQARRFVDDHEDQLGNLPVAYFFTCLALAHPSDSAMRKAQGYARKLEELSDRVTPVAVGRFAGVLDYHRLDRATRFAARITFSLAGVHEGDYRDWDTVTAWTRDVHHMMFPAAFPADAGNTG